MQFLALSVQGTSTFMKMNDGVNIMDKHNVGILLNLLHINNDSEVICYDDFDNLCSSRWYIFLYFIIFRFWYALNYYGITNVKVLNGGIKKWILEKRVTTNSAQSTVFF